MTSKCAAFYNAHIQKYKNTINELKHIFKDDFVIFDIGSNIGLFSLAICESLMYNKLYLFEPVLDYYNYSKHVLKDYNNIIFENVGISNDEGKTVIYKNTGDNIGWNSILLKDPYQSSGILPVDKMEKEVITTMTLTSYCHINKITKIDFIKIDVEGLEYRVIEGFLDTLRHLDKKPYLYVEVGWGTQHPEWDKAYLIYEELFRLGYKRVNFIDRTEDILFEPV